MVDDLLDLLDADPAFTHFMLDGQTIVLEDYLYLRPEREEELRSLVQEGRLLVGPWYVLPDEFLVSPESLIRNLLEGERVAGHFGAIMKVGYIPDSFGHISQMPQILSGFGIEYACVQRGLSDEPSEFWWQAPDGTRVLMAYLRDGYGNANLLNDADPSEFTQQVLRIRETLSPHCHTSQRLLMQGEDHTLARKGTSTCIRYANRQNAQDRIIHSNLPLYFSQVKSEIDSQKNLTLPTVTGELRSSQRHHLLPGVLSARVWIKQRNHECETLLEKWAEPYSTFSDQLLVSDSQQSTRHSRVNNPNNASILQRAWRMLLECHPHDSICGCSVDQVHDEMRPRFDQVEQISEEITLSSLKSISAQVSTNPPAGTIFHTTTEKPSDASLSILVFNPNDTSCPELAEATLPICFFNPDYEIVDDAGCAVTSQQLETNKQPLATLTYNRDGFLNLLSEVNEGKVTGLSTQGLVIQEVNLERKPDALVLFVSLSDFGEPNLEALSRITPELTIYLEDSSLDKFVLKTETVKSRVSFHAERVPALGYRTFWLAAKRRSSPPPNYPTEKHSTSPASRSRTSISNEFFKAEISSEEGSLSLIDLSNGLAFRNINHFIDGGDCGDVYNYCNPTRDRSITCKMLKVEYLVSPLQQTILVESEMQVPVSLEPGRGARSGETLPLKIATSAKLVPGVPRLDIHTEIDNPSKDHRLRVHFPTPFNSTCAEYDGQFDIVNRPLGVPPYDENWKENPRPEAPQRAFTYVTGKNHGLLVANRGLPEVEALRNADGSVEIALTLLRCIGWLSRDDFPTRRGHAGPALPTPGSQMIGHWVFDYSLVPFRKGDELSAFHQAYTFNAPLRAVIEDIHPGHLPGMASFIQVNPRSFTISAIKGADDGHGWIIRGYNLTPETIRANFKFLLPFQRVFRANLKEEAIDEIAVEDGKTVSTPVHGHEILTLRILTH